MAQVQFYHLTETPLDDALPQLVEKAVERKWRVVIQSAAPERRDALDAHLWAYKPASFLPHGRDGDHPAGDHPIFLTVTQDNPNSAAIRFLVDGAAPPDDLAGYERIMVMFDGGDEDALATARSQWKALKAASHDLTYYRQTPEGRWTKQA